MKKWITLLIGVGLISWGLLLLFGGLFLPVIGISVTWLQPWRFWPLVVVALGDFLAILALVLYPRGRGSAGMFIPALPILMTGALLLVASVFNAWGVWSYAWALIILALAFGFVLAGVLMRIIWLGIPAIIIGLNGLVLAFCSFTGLWHWWSFLWLIEPLSIGLILLLVASQTRSWVVALIGGIFCAFSLALLPALSGAALLGGWAFGLFWPVLFFLLGGLLLARGLSGHLRMTSNQ